MSNRRPLLSRLALPFALPVMLALSACGSGSGEGGVSGDPVANVAPPQGQQWSRVVRATEEGFLMGNPDAPIKLVEYGSFTCGACANFSVTSHEELEREFVDSGRVSFEMRPYIRNTPDLLLSRAAICAGPERFFPLATNIFAGFEDLMQQMQANPNAMQNIGALPEAERFTTLARALGLDQYFAARGLPADELNRCLADADALEALAQRTTAATERYEIPGTPTFLINGQVVESTTAWGQLRERLEAAGAR